MSPAKRLLLAFTLAAWVTAAQAYTPSETEAYLATAALLTVDWLQTRAIARNPHRWREKNPLLPEHPTVAQVNRHFAVGALLLGAAVYAWPEHRMSVLAAVVAVEVLVVGRNHYLGIRITGGF